MSASTPPGPDFRFEVALSFAGDNKRDKVRAVAKLLRDELGQGRVFFDEWFEAELAGLDANVVLQNFYLRDTRLVVTCVCNRYAEKPWTQEEWRAIQMFERGLRDAGSGNLRRMRFLPLRFGDGEVDGMFDTAIVPDVRQRSPRAIADVILERLRLARGGCGPEPPPAQASPGHFARNVLANDSTQRRTRYILYVARERIGSLFQQVSTDVLETAPPDLDRLLRYGEPGSRAVDEAARRRAVLQLFTVLEHLERSERIGDLSAIVRDHGRLDCDWYQLRAAFDVGRWEVGNPNVHMSAKVGDFTLQLSLHKGNLTGVNKEDGQYIPTSVSYAVFDEACGIPLSGLVRLATVDLASKTLRGSALYLVLEPLDTDLGGA